MLRKIGSLLKANSVSGVSIEHLIALHSPVDASRACKDLCSFDTKYEALLFRRQLCEFSMQHVQQGDDESGASLREHDLTLKTELMPPFMAAPVMK